MREKPKVIRILGLANGETTHLTGMYVKEYNPHLHIANGEYDGGYLSVTPNPADAMQFADAEAAARLWQSGPDCACHKRRADGKPNRPLTAYTVAIEELP